MSKSKLLRKSVHLVLIASLEKAIWNWMDTYPHEFTEIQVSTPQLFRIMTLEQDYLEITKNSFDFFGNVHDSLVSF